MARGRRRRRDRPRSRKKRRENSVSAEEVLRGPQIQLSNKGCPRYYTDSLTELGADPDSAETPPKRCGCPKGRCWYDEQSEKQRKGLPTLSPEEWNRAVAKKL